MGVSRKTTSPSSFRDVAQRRALRIALIGAALLTCGLLTASRAQTPTTIAPSLPPDGAVVGPRPFFEIRYAGIEDSQIRDARFRIALSRDGFRTESYSFDQRERRAGWTPGEIGRMLYHPRRPLADGDYEWRVSSWNGARWVDGPAIFRLRIDTVPPADVDGLRLRFDRSLSTIELDWQPVFLDREGGAEFVERYHVFRYREAPPWPLSRSHAVATVTVPTWVDDAGSGEARLTVYRVIAVDAAGNSPANLSGFE